VPPTAHLPIATPADVAVARRAARVLATALGFTPVDTERVVLAVSELATNLVRYAVQGAIVLAPLARAQGPGLQVESCDAGPGIADLRQALEEGFSSAGGLGHGLPAVQRLMDEVTITTAPDGTRIVARTWRTSR
jgi:serine/threonine-protein kinase RsbT